MIGSEIGRYKIVDRLGAGGMGEVYRAEDTTLGRSVALKFLAAHLLNDDEAKQRFLREAKAAAAITHPNICHVYEVGEEGGKTFLAMTYLKGETLEERIARGPFPLKEALDIGRQVAEGLAAAHAEGIVHRDIKPANIMISPDGRATILDFGLARLTEASKLTRADQTVGTAAYMSPEQIQGADVDHRTDIWALGCALYEMVAGLRPFKGQYDQALAYEIVNEEPEPLTSLRTGVPVELEFVVEKCLAKNSAERYQHVDELGVDLESLRARLASGKSRTRSIAGGPTSIGGKRASPRTESVPHWRLLSSVLLALVIAFGLLVLRMQNTHTSIEGFALAVNPPPETEFYEWGRPLISPDGRRLVFPVSDRNGALALWIRPLNSVTARKLPGTEGALYPFWSPDSRNIGFFANDRTLKRMDVDSLLIQTICSLDLIGRGADWASNGGPSGTIVFSPQRGGLFAVDASGGEPRQITELDESHGETRHREVRFLPDGRRFFYYVRANPEYQGVYVGSTDESPRDSFRKQRFLRADCVPSYAPGGVGLPQGYLLYVRDRTLFAHPFDPDLLEFQGDPIAIAADVQAASFYTGDFSVSANGVLVYRSGVVSSNQQLVWFDRSGNELAKVGEPGQYAEPRISPDGNRLAVRGSTDEGNVSDIWVLDLDRGGSTRITSDPEGDHSPVWSPGGDEIAYASTRGAQGGLYIVSAAGTGEPRLLSEGNTVSVDWSPDGRFILLATGYGTEPGTNLYRDLHALPLNGERTAIPVTDTDFTEVNGSFAPNGRWVAYDSDESGRFEVYVQPFPPTGERTQISTDGGRDPLWRRDGREMFFRNLRGAIQSVEISAGERLNPEHPRTLFDVPDLTGRYDVTADGQRFVVTRGGDRTSPPLTVVVNWQAKLVQE